MKIPRIKGDREIINRLKSIFWLNKMCIVFEAIFIIIGLFNYDNWYGVACLIVSLFIPFMFDRIYIYFLKKQREKLKTLEKLSKETLTKS